MNNTFLKRRFFDQIAVMFGREARKPAAISEAAQKIHFYKRGNRDLIAEKLHARAHAVHGNKWRNRRWAVLIIANLMFTFSFWLDIQILEGALTASRFVGFHLIDLNSALQVMLAHKHIIVNLVIGTGTVFVLWLLLGGRTFCSWVCPYHLLAVFAEKIHLWLVFAALALITGYTVYESISPTGILSRALIYGPGLALLWVFALLVFEVFFSRRAWCRYACPIGLTYGVVGIISPWNYPFAIPFAEVVMALLSGNGVILKVASDTLDTGKTLERVFASAELPDGLFRMASFRGARRDGLSSTAASTSFSLPDRPRSAAN